MAIQTILLKTGRVQTTEPGGPVYAPSNSAPKKVAIVKSMRFTNTGTGVSKLRAHFQKNGATLGSTKRRILPYDLEIPAGCTVIDDLELTLGSGEGIYLQVDTGTVDFVFSGLERDAV